VELLATLRGYADATGTVVSTLLALVLLIALPQDQRREARSSFALIAIHVVAHQLWPRLPAQELGSKIVHFISAFAFFASFVRTGFVFFTRVRLVRRARPWPKILRDVIQALLYFGIAMLALRAVGVEPSSLLTTSALLTAVLGLSMQETLGNLFAGLALQGQQTLSVGDWVRFADGPDGVGEVIEVNWRSTHFLTNHRVKIIVPNGMIARAVIRNYSRPTPLVRHDVDVLAPYDVSAETVRRVILDSIPGTPGVLRDPRPSVLVHDFSDSGVTYSVRYFIENYGDRDPIEGAVRQRILYAFGRAGIDFPFPHRHLLAPGLEGAVERFAPPGAIPKRAPELDGRLARFQLFSGLDPKAVTILSSGSRSLLYSPGEVIVRQGEKGTELFGIERGEVEILVAPEGGDSVRVATLGPGTIFGEAALLTGKARTATIVALSECELVAVSRQAFQSVIKASPELSEKFTTLLAGRLEQLNQTLHDAAASDIDPKSRSDLLLTRLKSFFGGA
jgi:small-conductance mechanosensitive channel/CRP-like cAMP-binding protein